ncbi:putative wd domain containing protein [Erysiphe neolycopersici]|uniref:Putative wd domain containing protein n=1 Tax=Erysiphe neolycopersici TaxID=212602 RepID=A0A420HRS3_9PEZI|nr:putative wd domain containing protein [Erysiphe neolycopersici]
MDVAATYTPLECLLVFQSLVAIGTEEKDFISISELLKKTPLVRDCPTFDAKRLEASALRDLYLRLLREELRGEEQNRYEESNKSPLRKRKLPSPKLASFDDCRKYKHKLPLLVERLYGRYRDYMIKAIKEDERNYVKLQGQIEKIERGDWDEIKLDEDESLDSNDKSEYLKNNGVHLESSNLSNGPTFSKESTPNLSQTNMMIQLELASKQASNGIECNTSSNLNADNTSSGNQTVLGQISARPYNLLSPSSRTRIQGESSQDTLYRNSQQSSPLGLVRSEHKVSQLSPQNYTESPQKSISKFHVTHPTQSFPPLSSSSSKKSKENKSLVKSINFEGSSVDVPENTVSQERYISSESQLTSPWKDISKSKESTPSKLPSSSNNIQYDQDRTLPFRPPQTSPTSNPEKTPLSPSQPLFQSKKQYSSPYDKEKSLKLMTPIQFSSNTNTNLASYTSIATDLPLRKINISTTGYGTIWNPTPTGLTPRNFTPLPPPEMEPISPILKSSKSTPVKKVLKKKGLGDLSRPLESVANKIPCPSPTKTDLEISRSLGVSQPSNSPIANKQFLNNESINSDVEMQVVTFPKVEDIDDTAVDKLTTREASKPPSSPRSLVELMQEKKSDDESRVPATVLWTRAFPKIAAQALQDISTDKNASMFANPIKEKDAPGYRNIILRPQDLKSIRIAINAGHRAALAAAPDELKSNATSVWLPISEDLIPPKGIINYAQLEKELMRMFANAIMFNADPRRGLGPLLQDASERSKEEAFGYSFDEDSIVKGTRDMFAAVEKKVSDLRSVERKREKSWAG